MRLTRTLALLMCVSLLFLGSATRVNAAGFWDLFFTNTGVQKNLNNTIEAVTKSEEEGTPSHESFVDDNLLNVQTSMLLFTAGPPQIALNNMSEEQKRIVYERYGKGGMIGQIGNGIAFLYTPAASSGTYVADALRSAHIIPQAQAQGLGFSALDPILETWKVFRNVAYFFFVIIFLVIGFMIMFRQKIGGQTVVTVQQAIPGVIISLIFVTFSYAIAGFLIDMMYLLMYLMIGLFSPAGGTTQLNQNIFEVGMNLIIGKEAVFGTVNNAISDFTTSITQSLTFGPISDFLGWLAGITLALVISIAILIATFKIFFELLKTYVSIVISIATAPLMLMLGAIPGQNNFFKWMKSIIGNLLAFPVVLMSLIIYDMFAQNTGTEAGFLPPYLPGRGSANAIITLVGIGVLLVIPDLIKEIKKLFGAEGGIWEQLGGQAITNVKGALKPTANIVTAAAVPASALGYGLVKGGGKFFDGPGTLGQRFARSKDAFVEGAAIGATAPLIARNIPKIVRSSAELVGRQAVDIAQQETTDKVVHAWESARGEKFSKKRKELEEAQSLQKELLELRTAVQKLGAARRKGNSIRPPGT